MPDSPTFQKCDFVDTVCDAIMVLCSEPPHCEPLSIRTSFYIVYLLTRQVMQAYMVEVLPEEEVAQQRAQFAALLDRLGEASQTEMEKVLAEREVVEPEPGLSPEVVARLREHLAKEERFT